MSQNKQILEYLKKGYRITPIDALNKFNCFRLGSRIYDLKTQGYNIEKNLISNNGKRYASYYLKLS